jgi:protein ImuB
MSGARFFGHSPSPPSRSIRTTTAGSSSLASKTLGDLAALPEAAVVAQFGREGRAAWRLAAGTFDEPVTGKPRPQPIVASLDYPSPVADRGMLAHTIGVLIEHALRDPRRTGWRVQTVRVRAALEQGASWMIEAMLKDPAALRERIHAPLLTHLERTPPTGAVESLAVEFTAFARGTDELQLFARDAAAAARAGRRRALRGAAREIHQRLKRHMLYRVVEVQPWSRLPERRYALIAFEP